MKQPHDYAAPILVTGPTGQTGKHVVRQLLERGRRVRALVYRGANDGDDLKAHGVEVVVGDLLDIESLQPALSGVRRAYFCYPAQDRLLEASTNFAAVGRTLDLVTVVNMSQIHARAGHPSALTRQHWLAERVFDWAQVGAVHLRATLFAENYLKFTGPSVSTSGKILLPVGDGRIALATCEDVASVAVGVLTRSESGKNEVYLVAGKQSLSQQEMAEIFAKVLNKPVEYVDLPLDRWREAAAQQGYPAFNIDHLSCAAKDWQEGTLDVTSDVIETVGGRVPTSFEEFIRANASRLVGSAVSIQ